MSVRPDPDLSRPAQPLAAASSSKFHAAVATADPVKKETLLDEAQTLAGHSALADAYAYLQKAVGLIAVSLPFVVVIGHFISGGHHMEDSISAYYYTHMG